MNVFVSYCGASGKGLANKLKAKLTQNNVDVWTYSNPNYTQGTIAWFEIYENIASHEWMVVIVTKGSATNINQKNEFVRALSTGKKVVAFCETGIRVPAELKGRTMGRFSLATFNSSCDSLVNQLIVADQREKLMSSENRQSYSLILNSLRRKTYWIDEEKAHKCRQLIVDSYLERSIIRKITKVGLLTGKEIEDLNGKHIWINFDIKDFNRVDVDYRLICTDIATEITSGEHLFLLDTIRKLVKPCAQLSTTKSGKLSFAKLKNQILKMISSEYRPSVLLAPIGVFIDFVHYFKNEIKWVINSREQLVIKEIPLTIYWSHKKVPSHEFIFFDINAIRWQVLPDDQDGAIGTSVNVSPLFKDKVDFFACTAFKMKILEPEAIKVVSLP